jgi:hypothetical protein
MHRDHALGGIGLTSSFGVARGSERRRHGIRTVNHTPV